MTHFVSKSGAFHLVPQKIWQDGSLTTSEKAVLACLFSYAHRASGTCTVPRNLLASCTGLALSSITKIAASLVRKGWITRKVQAVRGGVRAPNFFQLLIPETVVPARVMPQNPKPEDRESNH